MRQFFTELGGGTVEKSAQQENIPDVKPRSRSASGHPQPVMTVGSPEANEEETDPQELLMMFDEVQDLKIESSGVGDVPHPVPSDDLESLSQPIFIKYVLCQF